MSSIGYFTFAQNSKTDYVKLAYVCALSLKISQPNINKMSIAVTPKTKITENQKLIFDQIIEIPWNDDAKNADWKLQNEWKALHISPYDSTLKIDSDMFFNSNIEHWFKELQFYDFTICNKVYNFREENVSNNYAYREDFKICELPNLYSGLTWFKKYTEKSMEIFTDIENIFHNFVEWKNEFLKEENTGFATTDVAFALAAKLNDYDQNNVLKFIHMKTQLQNFSGEYIGENWTNSISAYITKTGQLRLGKFEPRLPIHYVIKDLISDEQIKHLEKIVGV
jgi:hypothetical protein